MSDWKVVGATRDRLGESVLWHPREQALYWVDFYEPGIRRLDPATGDCRQWRLDNATTIGSIAFAAGGRLLAATDRGVHLFNPDGGKIVPFADPNGGRAGIGYNDGKVDRDGRYWIGTYDLAEKSPRGILFRIDANRPVTIGDSGYVVCNGPAFSPDGGTLYFSDTMGRRIVAYDLDRATGRLETPRELVAFDESAGLPDGICVDRAGNLYVAHYGGGRISRVDVSGRKVEIISLPVRNVTSCCFGGPMLDTLYVTTAEDGGRHPLDGALFATNAPVPGLPEPVFLSSLG